MTSASIKKAFLGSLIIGAGFFGAVSIGGKGGGTQVVPLAAPYQEQGLWSEWAMAPEYTPALAGQVFDVTDYGADPTNVRNSTEGIRDALAAAKAWQASNANGLVTVYIPAGTYSVWANPTTPPEIIFKLWQDNLVIEGDGAHNTTINTRARAGVDPAGLVVDRGILFSTLGTPDPLDGIKIRGLRMTGNAPPNEFAGQFSSAIDPATGYPYSARGWDVNHKAVGIWDEVTNVIVEDCEVDNWRGEGIYAGGGLELGNMTVRRCLIYNNNASAVSMGGLVLVQDCEIYDAYNGLECFMLGGAQTLTVDGCIIAPARSGIVAASFGIAYLGYDVSALTVTNNQIGKCLSGVLLAEMASNVLIDGNTFTDCRSVYCIYQESYTGDGSVDQSQLNRWENITISNNTATALTQNVEAFVLSYANTGLNWEVSGNTLVNTPPYQISEFIRSQGASGDYVVTGNTIPGDTRPNYLFDGPRAVWGSNTITGYYANGTEYNSSVGGLDPAPVTFNPPWRKMRVSDMGTGTLTHVYQVDSYELSNFPTGFVLEMRRDSSNAEFTGVEVIPDPSWNSLTRGYLLYEGAVLTLTKGAGGKFDFTSYTAPTGSPQTITDTAPTYAAGKAINFLGRGAVTLSPAVAHVFTGHAGVAIGETVTINCNANTTIDHVPGNVEMSTGVDFVSAGTVALSATRAADGTLEVTIP